MSPSPASDTKRARGPGRLFFTLSILLVAGSIPAFGFWLATSILMYANGPLWLALAAGFVLFPVLPLAWDAYANVRRKRRQLTQRRWMSDSARIGLRVLVVNGLVVAGLLVFAPKLAFDALASRGDWMLDGRSGAGLELSRRLLLGAADRLAALHELARHNRYASLSEDTRPEDPPAPGSEDSTATPDAASPDVAITPEPEPARETPPAPTEVAEPAPEPAPPPPAPSPPPPPPKWPFEARLHAVVRDLPASVETSPEAVARHIAENVLDPFERARAIHDYVADRIAYDAASLARGEYPPFEPDRVFERKQAVCAGYAALFAEMARVAGIEAEVIAGFSREAESTLGNGDHAWNAFRVNEQWYLTDVTWDSGAVSGTLYSKRFGTDYFATPPEIFILSHYPAHPKWQLLEAPVARGEFVRQPSLRPSFYANGLALVAPTRSQVTVDAPTASLVLSNARDIYILVTATPKAKAGAPPERRDQRCALHYERARANVECPLPGPGTYHLDIFGGPKALQSYPHLGTIEVNYRG